MRGLLALRRIFQPAPEQIQLQLFLETLLVQHGIGGWASIRIGEPAQDLYVVLHGAVRVVVGNSRRNATAGQLLRRGQVFGWAALTPASRTRVASTFCVAATSVLVIKGDGLLMLMEEDHTLGFRISSQLCTLITSTLTAFAGG